MANARRFLLAGLLSVALIPTAFADEGMWLFNNPPRAYLEKKHQFNASKEWLEHVQRASVRFMAGGSGSFVSPDGLVMTNHHVGADALQKLGTKEHNYYRDGFLAKSREDELKCENQELNVLMSIEDVTEQVNAAVKPDMSPADAARARQAVIAGIEKESFDKTGLRSDVVTLYQGGQYHLYRYKKYTDVRLVFAPEQQIAFFGGDPDNFEYPRYDLDACFFRVYEDGKPAKTPNYLKWSASGPKENELVFVSGHPGKTDRSATVAELEFMRDRDMPSRLQRINRWEVLLSSWSDRAEENARRAKELLFSIQNSRKARNGMLAGLLDPELLAKKQAQEKSLKEKVASDPSLAAAKSAWDRIAEAEKVREKHLRDYVVLEGGAGFFCQLFDIARELLRAAEELPKPNADRLREYRDSNLDSLKQQLFSEEPLYNDFEELKLADGLTYLCEQLGYESALVQKVLNGKSPRQRAAELIRNTKVKDVAFRKKLFDGGRQAVEAAQDPLIEVARIVDADARAVRKIMETQVDEVKKQAHAQIAKARYAVEGDSVYPDATFTLRLAFGTVKGYEQSGEKIPFETKIAGLYERAREQGERPPFDLPKSWKERKNKLDLNTPFNFVCTADIIGGNSGSPVINRNAEVVGLIFDGNIQSLVLDFAYSDQQARAVSVHSQGILEALRKVYDANALADELTGKN